MIRVRKPKPDFNPDKENHVNHKWMVVKATQRKGFKGIQLEDGKEMKFGKVGAFYVKDEGKANEIRQEVGLDATVTRVRAPAPVSDQGHRYFFGQMPEMPWKKSKPIEPPVEGQENKDDGTINQHHQSAGHDTGGQLDRVR